jgi:hypothetical protein
MPDLTEQHKLFWGKVKPLVFKTIIGSIIIAALVGVAAMVFGDFNRLSLTLILITVIISSFALLAWYDADVSSKRSHHFAIIGLSVSFALLFIGIAKVVFPEIATATVDEYGYSSSSYSSDDRWAVWGAFTQWVGIVFVTRFALLHAHLLMNIHRRYSTPILQVVAKITFGLIALVAFLLTLPLLFTTVDFDETYWRLTGGVIILDVLGTILIPITHGLFKPRAESATGPVKPQPVWSPPVVPEANASAHNLSYEQAPVPAAPIVQQPVAQTPSGQTGAVIFESAPVQDRRLAWPRYVDGTPVPANADGSPNLDDVARY